MDSSTNDTEELQSTSSQASTPTITPKRIGSPEMVKSTYDLPAVPLDTPQSDKDAIAEPSVEGGDLSQAKSKKKASFFSLSPRRKGKSEKDIPLVDAQPNIEGDRFLKVPDKTQGKHAADKANQTVDSQSPSKARQSPGTGGFLDFLRPCAGTDVADQVVEQKERPLSVAPSDAYNEVSSQYKLLTVYKLDASRWHLNKASKNKKQDRSKLQVFHTAYEAHKKYVDLRKVTLRQDPDPLTVLDAIRNICRQIVRFHLLQKWLIDEERTFKQIEKLESDARGALPHITLILGLSGKELTRLVETFKKISPISGSFIDQTVCELTDIEYKVLLTSAEAGQLTLVDRQSGEFRNFTRLIVILSLLLEEKSTVDRANLTRTRSLEEFTANPSSTNSQDSTYSTEEAVEELEATIKDENRAVASSITANIQATDTTPLTPQIFGGSDGAAKVLQPETTSAAIPLSFAAQTAQHANISTAKICMTSDDQSADVGTTLNSSTNQPLSQKDSAIPSPAPVQESHPSNALLHSTLDVTWENENDSETDASLSHSDDSHINSVESASEEGDDEGAIYLAAHQATHS